MAGATTWSLDVNQAKLLPGAQQQLGSVLKSVAQVATRAHTESQDLGLRLWLGWSLGATPQLGSHRSGWPVLPSRAMVLSGSRLLLRTMSGSVAL